MKRTGKFDLPAVVVGGGLNALGIVRSLGSEGVPLFVLDADRRSPAMRSRYGCKMPVPSLEGRDFIQRLLALAGDIGGPMVLFLTEEKTVVTVSAHRHALAGKFLVRMPEHERLMALMQKQGFQDLAEAVGAPIPKTVLLQGPEDLPRIEKLAYPCVLKPNKKDYAYGARFKKAYKVASAAEAGELYRQILPVMADMVVQEWIEGPDSEIYFCLQYIGAGGEKVSSFAGRKIRSWPLRIGGTASCTAAWDCAEELADITHAFFAKVGFTGMGSMEYKRDQRDGKFYMVEPTVARTDFQEEVATLNGVNIPFAAYCHEAGLPRSPAQPSRVPVMWRDPLSDRWAFEEGKRIIDERSRSHRVRDAYWRWNDPVPWFDVMAGMLAMRLGSRR